MKKRKCDICKKSFKYGTHKHRYAYCSICKRETVHVTAAFGLPWTCFEKHPNDYRVCAKCGGILNKTIQKIAARIKAKIICSKCNSRRNFGFYV